MILFEEFDNSVSGANDLIILEACGLKSSHFSTGFFISLQEGKTVVQKSLRMLL